ncbi:MAG: hypothetical protein FJY65_06735 [Calditrichaeota bacterium]|nr:hypothetical protein [Calditrichota bacterium]
MPKAEFKEQLKRGLKELGAKAGELTIAAADFIEEQAQVGKLKFDILTLKRQIDRDLRSIGEVVLNISRSPKPVNPLEDKGIKQSLKQIDNLERQIENKRTEIAKVVEAARLRRMERAEKKAEPTPPPPPEAEIPAKKTVQRKAAPKSKSAKKVVIPKEMKI